MSLQAKIVKNITWTSLSALINSGGQLLILIYLVRLIAVEDFALMALVQFTGALSFPLLDALIGYSLLQSKQVSKPTFSALWVLSLGMACCFALVFWCLAPVAAWFYHSAQLDLYIQWGILALVAWGIGMPFRFFLQKTHAFRKIAIAQILGFLVYASFSVFLAIHEYGIWALLIAYLVRIGIENLLYLAQAWPQQSIALWQMNWSSLRLIQKGKYFAVERIVDVFSSQIDTLLIGKLLGMQALGIYDLAKRFLYRPANILSDTIEAVLLPVFLELKNLTQQKLLFQSMLNAICSIIMPLYCFLFISADLVSQYIYGDQAAVIAPIFAYLTIVIVLRSPRLPLDTLALGLKASKTWLFWKLLNIPIFVLSIVLGSTYDLEGLVIALIGLQFIQLVAAYFFLIRPLIGLSFFGFQKIVTRPLLLSIALTSLFFFLKTPINGSLFYFSLSLLFGAVFYLGISYYTNPSFLQLLSTFLQRLKHKIQI